MPNTMPALSMLQFSTFISGRRLYHGVVRTIAIAAAMLLAATIARAENPPFFKGVTVSCQTWGVEWQTPEMAQTLDELKSLGANSIAIHPYARIMNDGHVRFRTIDNDRHITVPLDWARDRGMSVMLVPHIAYWGSRFSWRGEINFERAEEWDSFFADYEIWIVKMARLAEEHRAPLFCVGLEFTHAEQFAARWRKIIRAVREVYHGKITYGANHDSYASVPFWDALDYIGVLAYFPLTEHPNPSTAELKLAWERRCGELEAFSQRNGGKQFIFTEIGYNESARAAAEPWSFKTGGEHAADIQAACTDAALSLTGKHPFLAGMFFWKWFPELPHDEEEDFCLQTPAIKALIANHWRDGLP
jgi:hypothetical protein